MSEITRAGQDAVTFGGSAHAIRHHYDVGNDFYELWLDESLTYSCAMWSGDEGDTLEAAQRTKLDFHLGNIALPQGGRLLDIGCGWGSLVCRALERSSPSRVVGLTLSQQQAKYLAAIGDPRLSIRVENWADHQPSETYDGIVSIGAFEHFADSRQNADERMDVYCGFFERCHDWLVPGGTLSLQTIVYGDMDASNANGFIASEVFPNAELPRPYEIFQAADRLFAITLYRDDGLDYARTCETWLRNLRRRRSEAIATVGRETVQRYERYLMLSASGFRLGRIGLARLKLVSIGGRHRRMS
jgi:cyclopropane-fatty-acyl-phospholipid synthase